MSVPGWPQRVRAARRWRVRAPLVLCVALASASPVPAVESGPQGIVRQFCRADAFGRRVSLRGWPQFIPIVEWPFEPAWDSVLLITGYSVGSPRPTEGGALDIDVDYAVVGQVSALGLETNAYVETVTFRVHAPEQGWRIIGPPPPPHIFGARVDIEALRRAFTYGALNFVPDSLFIWQMFRSAGWNVPFERAADLLTGTTYRLVDKPQAGDVVLYLRDGLAYHAGLLEAENQVASSTLNAGIVRTSVNAFGGEVRYLRLIEPEPEPPPPFAPPTRPPPTAALTAVKKPTVARNSVKGAKHGAQPSAHPRVKGTGKVRPGVQRTPVAHPGTP
jgi:hypothetical protein